MKNPLQISIMGTSRWYPSAKGGLEGTGMRVALPLLLIAVLVSNVSASVTAKVYLADEEIPLALKDPNVPDVFRDIMVGTHLTIFIESDALVDSAGSLVTSDPVDKGFLAGRGYPVEYQNSVLEAAGPFSFILDVIRFGENGDRKSVV